MQASSKTLTCTLEHSYGASEIWAVEDYDTSAEDYEIWGTVYDSSSAAQNFCCVIDAQSACEPNGSSCYLERLVILGSLQADEINLGYLSGSTLHKLKPTTSTPQLTAFVFGGDDRDTIHGSDHDSISPPYYTEWLCGQGNNDYIDGHPGDDFLYGGDCGDHGISVPARTDSGEADGADTLLGGYGDDVCYGDLENDTISGGHGDDEIFGGPGDDVIFGNSGADLIEGNAGNDRIDGGPGSDYSIDGGNGEDIICGGPDADTLFDTGTIGNDIFWGASSVDMVTCGPGDSVDVNSDPGTSCTILSTPPSCP